MGYRRTVAPTVEPMLVTEVRLSARIDQYEEDALLAEWIQTARQWIEQSWDLALIDQTIEETFDKIPKSGFLRLTVRPVAATTDVTSVKYYDEDNVLQTMSAADYVVSLDGHHCLIGLGEDASWPSTYARRGAFVVTYTAGFGASASDVPRYIKSAIRMKVTDLYEQRISQSMPKGIDSFEALLSPLILRRA